VTTGKKIDVGNDTKVGRPSERSSHHKKVAQEIVAGRQLTLDLNIKGNK
jgi:hypothetical protein